MSKGSSKKDSLHSLIVAASKLKIETLTPAEARTVLEALNAYEATDPVRFVEKQLGFKPWSRQAEMMRAVAQYDRVAVRSGHKVGKSTTAASMALWWVCRFPQGRVVMTAPTDRQVKDILWRELVRLYRTARRPIGGKLSKNPEDGLKFADGREVVGFSTNKPEKISGYSGPSVLFIVDEGSGVEEVIFEAIEGNRAGGAHLCMFSNPTKTSGTFFEAFKSQRETWHLMHVSTEESPNVTGEAKIPGLATPEWIAEKLEEWGEDSPLFQVRVRGNFPSRSESSVIGLRSVESAIQRWRTLDADALAPLEIGVDVARFGDDETVIQPVRGKWAYSPTVVKSMDTVQVANRVRQVAIGLRNGLEVPIVRVDVIGVGAGVADILRTFEEVEVADVNVSESSTIEEPGTPGYHRLRDQLWFQLKAWLEDGGAIPDDGKLQSDLLAPTYRFSELGKLKVESKDDIKKRLKRSPDRADALAMAVHRTARTVFDNWREASLRLP